MYYIINMHVLYRITESRPELASEVVRPNVVCDPTGMSYQGKASLLPTVCVHMGDSNRALPAAGVRCYLRAASTLHI